ncbi:MAG: hypothetical protein IKZ02_00835 [Alphaproteobacteria bacterium]|nr:hypothetical protein [Alphaproteobacteria bacterium]
MTYFINDKTKMIYTGDMRQGDRPATSDEITELLRDKRTYSQKRLSEYPSVGDMIDAFCKAKAGDESELTDLMQRRQEIKNKYPKE